jgi:hypothetical protein
MEKEIRNFILGLVAGIFITLMIFNIFGINPIQIERRYNAEIVQRGFGEYYVNTNTVPPSVEFRWKE